MTDYNKLTVAKLRSLLKDRGIASTGLTRKQQIVDKLIAADRENAPSQAAQDDERGHQVVATESQAAGEVQEDASAPEKPRADNNDATDVAHGRHVTLQPIERFSSLHPAEEGRSDLAVSKASSVTLQADEPEAVSQSQTPIPTREEQEKTQSEQAGSIASSSRDLSTLSTQEVTEDNLKRKRRSPSPPVDAEEAAHKKLKQSTDGAKVHLGEDAVLSPARVESFGAMDAAAGDDEMVENPTTNDVMDVDTEHGATLANGKAEDDARHDSDAAEDKGQIESSAVETGKIEAHMLATEINVQPASEPNEPPTADGPTSSSKPSPPETASKRPHSSKDNRYKELFHPASETARVRRPSFSKQEERVVEPALHAATAALYIRDFMRPLQPASLRDHLIQLATPPNGSPSASILEAFHLDSIRTHCFAQFSNVSAASRVRSAIHNCVWPDERTRKPLWADFVPEDKAREWIGLELNGGGGRTSSTKRWEVVYEEDAESGMQAIFQEVGKGGPARPAPARSGAGVPNAPLGPRSAGLVQQESRPSAESRPPAEKSLKPTATSQSFLALDSLFKSTAAKPKLYFLPASDKLAQGRLEELTRSTRRGFSWTDVSDAEEFRRYTFEDDNMLVDNGPIRLRQRDGGPSRGRGRHGGYGGGFGGYPQRTRGGWGGR